MSHSLNKDSEIDPLSQPHTRPGLPAAVCGVSVGRGERMEWEWGSLAERPPCRQPPARLSQLAGEAPATLGFERTPSPSWEESPSPQDYRMGKEDSVRTVFITLLLNLCPGCQTQSQQCKEDQSSREATVKGWHSSCLPTVPGPAPPATGLSTPLHLQPHSIAESEEGQLHCSLSPVISLMAASASGEK